MTMYNHLFVMLFHIVRYIRCIIIVVSYWFVYITLQYTIGYYTVQGLLYGLVPHNIKIT